MELTPKSECCLAGNSESLLKHEWKPGRLAQHPQLYQEHRVQASRCWANVCPQAESGRQHNIQRRDGEEAGSVRNSFMSSHWQEVKFLRSGFASASPEDTESSRPMCLGVVGLLYRLLKVASKTSKEHPKHIFRTFPCGRPSTAMRAMR